jgi:hypothetical protein
MEAASGEGVAAGTTAKQGKSRSFTDSGDASPDLQIRRSGSPGPEPSKAGHADPRSGKISGNRCYDGLSGLRSDHVRLARATTVRTHGAALTGDSSFSDATSAI